METVFWISAGLLVYPYVIYPLLLAALKLTFPSKTGPPEPSHEPATVTVIVSAHNEAAVIEEKIRTTLACDYPAGRLSVLVVSDASTDETNTIVARLAQADPSVRLLALEEHRGKTAGLNIAMEDIDTDIVVFTDANAIFDVNAVRELADRLLDPSVGYVVGAAHYEQQGTSTAGESEGLYWRYELAVKQMESDFGSVVGGDGAIYAIRRVLYQKLEPEDINDFVNPLQIIAQGFRGVFCATARAYEAPADDFGKEFRRKRRIVCRSWGALLRYSGRLEIGRNPRFLFMLLSHKVIRWATMLWVLIAFSASVYLVFADAGAIYGMALFCFLVVFVLAASGWYLAGRDSTIPGAFSIPYYFIISNLAAFLGLIDYARGNRYVTWEHVRLN